MRRPYPSLVSHSSLRFAKAEQTVPESGLGGSRLTNQIKQSFPYVDRQRILNWRNNNHDHVPSANTQYQQPFSGGKSH